MDNFRARSPGIGIVERGFAGAVAAVSGWRVDPARVPGVLAGVDEDGARLEQVVDATDEMVSNGLSSPQLDRGTAVASAWQDFFDERRCARRGCGQRSFSRGNLTLAMSKSPPASRRNRR